jgi:gluconolactonase
MATTPLGLTRLLPRALAILVLPLAVATIGAACNTKDKNGGERGGAAAAGGSKQFGSIERKDPRFDKLIARDATIEKLADGFEWAEGPVWVKEGYGDKGYLLFSDVIKNVVHKWKPGQGVTEFLKPSGYSGSTPRGGEPGSNGLTLDPQGLLVLCEHGDRRVARLEKDGKTQTTLASSFEGKQFNSPNDLCYDRAGNLFFTDPPYGLVKQMEDPEKELPFQGVYRLSKEGELSLLTRDMSRPNGIALSPDEKTVYVCNSDPAKPVIMAFDLDNGRLLNGRVFFDAAPLVKAGRKGNPDGLKLDRDGNVFATGPAGVLVIAPDGKHLGTINPGNQLTANCNWGGDGSVLYITADMNLCRVKTRTIGNRW